MGYYRDTTPREEKTCRKCNFSFLPSHIYSQFCGEKCRREHYLEKGRASAAKYRKLHPVKTTKHFWVCPDCDKKRELDFDPLEVEKLDLIICECGYENKV